MAHPDLQKENQELHQALANLNEKAQLNRTVLEKLFDIELNLLACRSLPELLQRLLVQFKASFSLEQIHLILLDPEYTVRQLLTANQDNSPNNLQFVINQHLLREIHPEDQLSLFHTVQDRFGSYFPSSTHPPSKVALLPLIRHDCLIGSLHLGCHDSDLFDLDQLMLSQYLRHLASVISICFENCISQQNLQRQSSMDVLTKVYNRRAFEQEITKELSRCSRTGEPLGCLFLDLDHFKRVNDTHGHQAGDTVLREVGKLLKQKVRNTDIIGRYGGEEFAILLPGCDESGAQKLALGLCQAIASMQFCINERHSFRITASIGVAADAPRQGSTQNLSLQADTLIQAADRALYQAKHNGRNRLFLASALD
ncbi:GGDEF domain-containing protein [Pontibacter sp. JAM-7]|uniref:GGDEF domain-containing protein n=1 Tax=Pontibacter sp. JAM-7 TaxID=3366581 RepID=UPI003AF91A32